MDLIKPEHNKLNLGCGFNKLLDFWNVDIEKTCNPDQVLDLEQFPWPFEDNTFEQINAESVLEHVGQEPKVFTKILSEMYRISTNNCIWKIVFPHHRCDHSIDDHTHVRFLSPNVFKLFDQKVNFESLAKRRSDSTHGLNNYIDIEIMETNFNLTGYFLKQLQDQMVGANEMNVKLNTLSNVCESIEIEIKVHKPGRYQNWFSKMKK